jgi:hypothetical protein
MRLLILLAAGIALGACSGDLVGPSEPALATVATAPTTTIREPVPEDIPGGISPEVWHHALRAHREAFRAGRTASALLTIIDYSRPATEKRLWIVDVRSQDLLDTEYVAHGKGSGDRTTATRFSNKDGSRQSSLGTFITGDVFFGIRGRSLELHGIEEGINDNAYTRGILIHGTRYVSEARALEGTQGVTEGCAGVPAKSAKRLIGRIAHGTVVFVWYPDRKFLEQSEYLDREEATERLSADS